MLKIVHSSTKICYLIFKDAKCSVSIEEKSNYVGESREYRGRRHVDPDLEGSTHRTPRILIFIFYLEENILSLWIYEIIFVWIRGEGTEWRRIELLPLRILRVRTIRISIHRCVKCIKLRGTKQVQTQQRSSVPRLQYRNLFPGNKLSEYFLSGAQNFRTVPSKTPSFATHCSSLKQQLLPAYLAVFLSWSLIQKNKKKKEERKHPLRGGREQRKEKIHNSDLTDFFLPRLFHRPLIPWKSSRPSRVRVSFELEY